jgi:hypothetical protein
LVERFGYGVENGDPEAGERPSRDMDDGAAMANRQHRELRIRQLKELIRSAVVLELPDDDVAGMLLNGLALGRSAGCPTGRFRR